MTSAQKPHRRTDPLYATDQPHDVVISLSPDQKITAEALHDLCGILPIAELSPARVAFTGHPEAIAAQIGEIRDQARAKAGGPRSGLDRTYQSLRWIHKAVAAQADAYSDVVSSYADLLRRAEIMARVQGAVSATAVDEYRTPTGDLITCRATWTRDASPVPLPSPASTPGDPPVMLVRIKPFTVEVDPTAWRTHFPNDDSPARIRSAVQEAVEAWIVHYVRDLKGKADD